jgi:DNA-binding CsgD family transcriptional regulator
MRGLAELFDARVIGLSCGELSRRPGEFYRTQVQLHYGFTPEQERMWLRGYCAPDRAFRSEYLRRLVSIKARFFTVRRQDVTSDEEWYALPEAQAICRPCDVDPIMNSCFISLSLHRLFGIGVHRGWGQPQFTVEERQQLRRLHVELARAWRHTLAGPADKDATIERLPDRLRQVLWLLCLGRSEKEVAAQLDLSRHTVHNHVRRLYHGLSVSSRGELLSRALTGGSPAPVVFPDNSMNQFRPYIP